MKKFLMLLVAGTLVLSIAGCKKEVEEPATPNKGDAAKVGDGAKEGAKEDAKEVVDDAAAKVKKALD
ncbi:MAG: hypothetical protein HN904_30385 [Victivallales bacterium]|jgi:hypothetical protein|nr:hypothetical protein [Victivallales bacterium]